MVPTSLPALSAAQPLAVQPDERTDRRLGAVAPRSRSLRRSPTSFRAFRRSNYNFVGGLTGDISTAYATLLPTADIATALALSLPSYDVNLFLDGITQAINGNPVQGLMNAFGYPIAANVGVTTIAVGFEFIAIENSLDTILTGTPNPGVD